MRLLCYPSFAVFLCLQCAGVHRGFGVHISFVRSVSMDTWHEEQIKRMQLGGNAPFRNFMTSYPAEGGYNEGMSPHDKYHSWAATQYREKLDAELAGKTWSSSAPPASVSVPARLSSPPGRPSSAQGLRKSRASARSNMGRSTSPASFNSSAPTTPNPSAGNFLEQKAANEAFFSTLGEANASRSADLPPSQGGRYQGFGNTPSPSQHPSYGLSSAAAPSLSEFQENPVPRVLYRKNVIQPGMEKVMDPTFQAGVKGYVTEAGKRAGEAGRTANMWTKHTIGVDVAEQVGGVVGTVRDKIGTGPQNRGYGSLQQSYEGETSALYEDHEDDFFGQYESGQGSGSLQSPAPQTSVVPKNNSTAKKPEDWDEWKDF
ncbi:hypothetical protein EW026_g5574 [Hermanssonia centrifuga]|uniref:Arf-GAP domain-containing protein n=1 Tax=Hermanssonia centrifuga TaxID=98765 RepID=A0A4S4KDQ3_9APHY|nr:hypothetical protein EW026_g5574 [Hermanssonia centrifuga]